jgi:hypothetical protein
MSAEILNPEPSQTPQNPLFEKQKTIINKIHFYTGISSGEIFDLGLHVYYDPSTFNLSLKNSPHSEISFIQTRCETDELGVKSKHTLRLKTTGEKGVGTTTYRLSLDKAMKSYVNGSDPKFSEMSQQDFQEYTELLDIINGKLR